MWSSGAWLSCREAPRGARFRSGEARGWNLLDDGTGRGEGGRDKRFGDVARSNVLGTAQWCGEEASAGRQQREGPHRSSWSDKMDDLMSAISSLPPDLGVKEGSPKLFGPMAPQPNIGTRNQILRGTVVTPKAVSYKEKK